MPAGQEAEHRFPMGGLPQEVEICQRPAKLTELLRLAWQTVPERSVEKTGSHDVGAPASGAAADEPAPLACLKAKASCGAASLAQSLRRAGNQMGDAGGARWPDPRLVPLRPGIRVSDQPDGCCGAACRISW